jgi:hypothetical protein
MNNKLLRFGLMGFLAFHFSFLVFHCSLPAQVPSNVSLKFLGFTIHPFGDRTANLQPYKLDKNARFVMNFGGVLGYERFIFEDVVSIKGLQAVFADCSAGLASVTHAAVRGTFLNRNGHRLSLGFGPALIIRQDWARLPDYQSSGFMNTGYLEPFGPIQWKIFWYGIEMEYDWKMSEHLDFSASLTPGVPMAITMGFGLKYWFERDYREKIYLPKMKKP